MNYGFVIDNRKCIGCHACTVACKAEHGTPIGVNRTWVKYVEKGIFPDTRRLFTVHRCNHCEDAPCVEICPVTCLHMREDGIVDFNRERCIGCKACMQACPYDALHIDPDTQTSSKCNYCAHRTDRGLEPACVIVCPVRAIIPGDMDDPGSEISRTLSRHQVSVRKPEKNTRPKLFYIDADAASLRPEMAPAQPHYMGTEQAAGVGHFAARGGHDGGHAGGDNGGHEGNGSSEGAGQNGHAHPTLKGELEERFGESPPNIRRAYDIPQRGVLWGWEVSGYLWTKSIATGALFLPLLLQLTGLLEIRQRLGVTLGVLSLVFLGLTGALLVKDLDKPSRFLYVLLRPQWKSWLVRGAYIINVFGGLATLWLLLQLLGIRLPWVEVPLVMAGVMGGIYTAFLFGQAKGRDLWQSPLLPLRMLLTCLMTGGAVVVLLGLVTDQGILPAPLIALEAAIAAHLVLIVLELVMPHGTPDAELAMSIAMRGSLRVPFWSSILLGNVAPLAMLMFSANGLAVLPACILVLLFALVGEHVWVRAPQLVSLS